MSGDPGLREFRFGDCVLDLHRGVLERAGALAPVRAKTFALLRHFACNPGRVLSKDELLDAVWPGVHVTEGSLSQAIRDLRRAIGDERQEVVRTIARRGYLFALPLDVPGPASAAPADRPAAAAARVAVTPLRNLSDAGDAAVLLDCLVEEITNGLARFKTVEVIARHSAFAASAEAATSRESIAARLGADYIVDGSVRRVGERLLVTVALVETQRDRQLWGETFDCSCDDLLALQEIVPRRIVCCLAGNIESAAMQRWTAAPTGNFSAFEHLAHARALLRGYGDDANERGRANLRQAIELDPGFGLAHAYLALADVMIAGYGMAPRAVLEDAKARALTATDLAPDDARCHRILGWVRSLLEEHGAAERSARRAYDLNPCDAETMLDMSLVLVGRGRAAEALDWIERAIAINPLHPPYYHFAVSLPLYLLGRYDESAAEMAHVPKLGPRAETRLAATLAMAGRMDEAARHLDRAEALSPGWRHLDVVPYYHFERSEDAEHLLAGIRAALAGRAGLAS